ncbi:MULTISPECIES: PLP-dependent aminotransferase family protein [unclassified Methylophaga]|uniref:aminotransferase-like domain-containing protein n=1 Tax=unclassified Methylophaga TaxID=2629249 RepID=UPI000C8EB2C8|nr:MULTISPECIES: PLP-dependent aminotransferase family protein [unclassified Methylophaga]MBN46123.1 GntR family transcriptional regulator [Methylophaga sp.]|tara:strand:+ start:164886 stop:166277 length:1392 start_codon:yes stop_codon:yes gene_type:complete
MPLWKPRIEADAKSKYLGIVEALEADIYSGYVKAGDRLPAQRAVAEALNVDLTTVTRAFNEARRRGLIDATTGRGSYVRHHVESKLISHISEARPLLDLSMNNPPQPESAGLQQHIPQGIAQLIAGADRVLQLHYQDSAGNPHDRSAAAGWLRQTIDSVTVERTLITGGAQSALYAILHCMAQPGDIIACGEFVYPGLKSAAEQLRLTLQPLTMDEEGVLPDAFEQACRLHAMKAIYLVPSMDNPTTATMSLLRRQQIVTIADEYDITIIEDDPYSPLQTEPVKALVDLAAERTWYIRTLSKCITPALRLAYVIAPSNSKALGLTNVLRAMSVMASPLMAALVSRWIYDGRINRFAEAIREENRLRQQIAGQVLTGMEFYSHEEGHHIWLQLPTYWQASAFAEQATVLGVSVVACNSFGFSENQRQAVRLSLGLSPDHATLSQALTILRGLLTQPASSLHHII